jgi:hypothetical protein
MGRCEGVAEHPAIWFQASACSVRMLTPKGQELAACRVI